MCDDIIFQQGKDCALSSGSIDDCPYGDYQWKEKRSWVLGYIAGIQAIWGRSKSVKQLGQ